jgi:hypothetical protein
MNRRNFPLYRKLANGQSFYRIDSAERFTEVQRVGGRCVVHRFTARIHPDRVRLAELLDEAHGHTVTSTAEEFDRWLAACEA